MLVTEVTPEQLEVIFRQLVIAAIGLGALGYAVVWTLAGFLAWAHRRITVRPQSLEDQLRHAERVRAMAERRIRRLKGLA